MPRLLYRDYRKFIDIEQQSTDWPVPRLPEVVSWREAPLWLRCIAAITKKITSGRTAMTYNFSVMLNSTIITPDPDKMPLSTYFHECWHFLQIKEAGGWFPFLLKYFLLPFPVCWTYRSKMEWEAYAISSWVTGIEVLGMEYRKSGKQYTLSIGAHVCNDLVVDKFSRERLKNIFFSQHYLYMDINWKTRARKFEIVRPDYFFKKGDVQCIVKVPWRGEDEYTPAMKGFYQLMHRVLTKY